MHKKKYIYINLFILSHKMLAHTNFIDIIIVSINILNKYQHQIKKDSFKFNNLITKYKKT